MPDRFDEFEDATEPCPLANGRARAAAASRARCILWVSVQDKFRRLRDDGFYALHRHVSRDACPLKRCNSRSTDVVRLAAMYCIL